ncbi:hypothetical protein D3791_05595 [Glutamicibacter mishrai]|uniref:Uncharacterized protein n=1 Tax=Glutamicibacter mishrai TaxID=1775880 RepID=A0A6H0SJR4_9MICC|nr:hypothetical protein D3791_05595 [Glutamicibacter mishrai]
MVGSLERGRKRTALAGRVMRSTGAMATTLPNDRKLGKRLFVFVYKTFTSPEKFTLDILTNVR